MELKLPKEKLEEMIQLYAEKEEFENAAALAETIKDYEKVYLYYYKAGLPEKAVEAAKKGGFLEREIEKAEKYLDWAFEFYEIKHIGEDYSIHGNIELISKRSYDFGHRSNEPSDYRKKYSKKHKEKAKITKVLLGDEAIKNKIQSEVKKQESITEAKSCEDEKYEFQKLNSLKAFAATLAELCGLNDLALEYHIAAAKYNGYDNNLDDFIDNIPENKSELLLKLSGIYFKNKNYSKSLSTAEKIGFNEEELSDLAKIAIYDLQEEYKKGSLVGAWFVSDLKVCAEYFKEGYNMLAKHYLEGKYFYYATEFLEDHSDKISPDLKKKLCLCIATYYKKDCEYDKAIWLLSKYGFKEAAKDVKEEKASKKAKVENLIKEQGFDPLKFIKKMWSKEFDDYY